MFNTYAMQETQLVIFDLINIHSKINTASHNVFQMNVDNVKFSLYKKHSEVQQYPHIENITYKWSSAIFKQVWTNFFWESELEAPCQLQLKKPLISSQKNAMSA